MTDRDLLELLVQKVTGLDKKLTEHDYRFTGIEKTLTEYNNRFSGIETEIKDIKTTLTRIETRQNAIFEQTAGLSEFRTEMLSSVKEIHDNQKSLSEIIGEHEMHIRSLRRRPV